MGHDWTKRYLNMRKLGRHLRRWCLLSRYAIVKSTVEMRQSKTYAPANQRMGACWYTNNNLKPELTNVAATPTFADIRPFTWEMKNNSINVPHLNNSPAAVIMSRSSIRVSSPFSKP